MPASRPGAAHRSVHLKAPFVKGARRPGSARSERRSGPSRAGSRRAAPRLSALFEPRIGVEQRGGLTALGRRQRVGLALLGHVGTRMDVTPLAVLFGFPKPLADPLEEPAGPGLKVALSVPE